MSKPYKPYQPEQDLLLPPSLKDWLPEKHLAYFVSEVVDEPDPSEIYAPSKAPHRLFLEGSHRRDGCGRRGYTWTGDTQLSERALSSTASATACVSSASRKSGRARSPFSRDFRKSARALMKVCS